MADRAAEAENAEAGRCGARQQDGPHRLEADDDRGKLRQRKAQCRRVANCLIKSFDRRIVGRAELQEQME
jgi:hypothetical protein